jgi:hypothetical protein
VLRAAAAARCRGHVAPLAAQRFASGPYVRNRVATARLETSAGAATCSRWSGWTCGWERKREGKRRGSRTLRAPGWWLGWLQAGGSTAAASLLCLEPQSAARFCAAPVVVAFVELCSSCGCGFLSAKVRVEGRGDEVKKMRATGEVEGGGRDGKP